MYNKNKLPIRYVILIVLVIVAIFLAIVFKVVNEDRRLSPVEQSIKDAGLFVNKVIYAPINFIEDKLQERKEKNNIYEKYKKLKEQIDKTDLLQAKNDELRRELESMKKILELDQTLSNDSYLNATVINRNLGYWYNTITIDKGSYNGVEVDMPVIVSEGLIGKVVSTTTFNSTVKLLTNEDRNNKISVKIKVQDKYIYGLLNNYNHDNNTFEVSGIDENTNIPLDSMVTTTGLGDLFPSGILVGRVKNIETDNFDLAKIVEVTSDVDFNDLSFVTILKRQDDDK